MERSDEGLEMARAVVEDVRKLLEWSGLSSGDPLFTLVSEHDRFVHNGANVTVDDVPGLIMRSLDGLQDFIETGYTDRLRLARVLPRSSSQ